MLPSHCCGWTRFHVAYHGAQVWLPLTGRSHSVVGVLDHELFLCIGIAVSDVIVTSS